MWSSPIAAIISASACTVLRWNWWTRSDLSGTSRARCSLGSWVVTPDRALVRVAALRLDAADGEHEGPGRVAPVRAQGHRAGHRRRRHHLAAGADLEPVADAGADQGVLHREQPFGEGAPSESENSSGAAPVPPSPPSTTMKSA